MEIFKTLEVCGIQVDIYNGPIGCSISGGADSSILAYILLKYAPGPINFYTTESVFWPNRIQGCREVYKKLLQMVPRDDTTLTETVIHGEQEEHNLFETPRQDAVDGKINIVYSGITANPPDNPDFGYPGENMSHRQGNMETRHKYFYTPFINHDKKKVSEIYQHYDVLDKIYPLTFSCVLSPTEDHCGDCWWCAERVWGFGRLV